MSTVACFDYPAIGGMDISLLGTIDRNYRVPFEILVSSLLLTKAPSTAIEWHVITDEAGSDWDAWQAKMQARHGGQRVRFILDRLPELASDVLPLRGRARPITYARIFAPERLATVASRLLYLDADMIVLRPIEELWKTDLGSSPCACCQDIAIPTVSSAMAIGNHGKLKLNPQSPYFNAGVMLMDTLRWKERAVARKALDYLASNFQTVNLFDQEALNAVLGSDWRPVSYRWNLIASVAGRSFLDTSSLRQDDYEASLQCPGIVHYAGILKPWLNPFLKGRWFELYRAALRQALPEHRFDSSMKRLLQATYDAGIRRWLYPLERTLWQARRGF